MKSLIMQPIFLDEVSCLHIDSCKYKYCEFLHDFISLASNSTIKANFLDFQSSKNVFPGARCLAKSIPREFQELLFSVATFADVCTHPPSCTVSPMKGPHPLRRIREKRCCSVLHPQAVSGASLSLHQAQDLHGCVLGVCEQMVKPSESRG